MTDLGKTRQRDPRTIAIFRSPVFNASEGFVQAQAADLTRYRPLVVGLEDKGNAIPALAGRILLPASTLERLRLTLLGDPAPLARRLARDQPALIHAHFATDGLLALPLAKRLTVPLITTLRGYDVTRSLPALLRSGRVSWMRYALGRRRLMREGRLFLTVSEALRDRAIAQGYPAERTVTHYNGVDLDRFRPGGEPEGKTILHVGRLVEKKGTSVLLRAFATVVRGIPDARLLIVGDGPLRAALEREAVQLGVADAVHFAGALPHAEVTLRMQRAWVLACPSLTARDGDAEGLPNSVVEAAACGLPVVGSRHSGIPEAVVDGETGLLVRERDPAGLAAALVEILRSPARRATMGKAARDMAGARFDLTRQMERLERIYDEVIATAVERRG